MMIDYEKLKLAYDLVEKTGTHYFTVTRKKVSNIFDGEITLIKRDGQITEGIFFTLDFFIEYLNRLIASKNKYKVGQTVYFVDDEDLIQSFTIKNVEINRDGIYCYQSYENMLSNTYWLESYLFLTKNDLIQDRIDYWTGLMESQETTFCPECSNCTLLNGKCLSKECNYIHCTHKDDGLSYFMGSARRCIKCGGMYVQ